MIKINIDSNSKAEKIMLALTPEVKATERFRSQVNIRRRDKTIILFFKAPDITSLRASVNSFSRWAWLLNQTLEALDTI